MSKIVLKKSSVVGKVPTTSDIDYGELALNYADGKLYYKKSDNTIDTFVSATGTAGVTSVDGNTGVVTSAQLLTAIKKEDGSGSGLDADLLDGLNTSSTNTASTVMTRDSSGLTGIGGVNFDTTYAGASALGRLTWNDGDGTLDLGLKGGNVTLQLGQEEVVRVFNASGTTLNEGEIVRIVGSQGDRISVDRAQANAESTSANTLGMVTETIASGAEGFVTTSGLVNKLNTSALSQGAIYLSPTVAGGYTQTKPTAPNHVVTVGFVSRIHNIVGSIFVKVDNGYELDELHNVLITSVANNNLLQYDSANSYWKNVTPASVTGVGSAVQLVTGRTISLTGDVTYTSGSFDGTANVTGTATLANSGVTAGTYKSVTVDAKGRVTSGTNPTTLSGYGITDAQPLDSDLTAIAALTGTSGFLKTNGSGTWSVDTSTYLTSITSSNVTTALGYTPENNANKGIANGYASLDSSGKVPSTQLPSYVDDVLEYANLAALPVTGTSGIIYITQDTNKTYRWSGSAYVEISASPGTTDSLTEGSTNLYFTTARARSSISATQNLTYNSTTGVITGPDLSGYLTSSTASSTYQPLDADLTSIAGLAGTTGLLKKTAANTWSLDTNSYLTGNQSITFSGDVSGSGSTSVSLTLANSGVTAGTYKSVTVDTKGRVTSGTNPTTLSGYGITDAQPLDADLTSIAGLSGTSGFLKKTAADTWTLDTNSYLTGNQSITFSGDATGSGTTSIALTLNTVPVSKGGTGLTTLTANAVLIGNGTSAISSVSPGASGNILTSNGTSWVSSAPSGSSSGITGTASGTVTAGTPAVMNDDGTISSVQILPDFIGSAAYISDSSKASTQIHTISVGSNKVATVFRRNSDGAAVCIISTISGETVTIGTPVVVSTGSMADVTAAYDTINEKLVVTCYSSGPSALAYVGTISGTSVTFGSLNSLPTISSLSVLTSYYDVASGKIVVCGNFNSSGQAVVGTVSGSSITFGALTQFSTSNTPFITATYSTAASKGVIAYSSAGTSGKAVVATVSGTTITFGSEISVSASSTHYISSTYDSASDRVLLAYTDVGNSNYGTVVAGVISGNSITFGSAFVFEASAIGIKQSLSYNTAVNKTTVVYTTGTNAYSKILTVSNTTITAGSRLTVSTGGATVTATTAAYVSDANRWLLTVSDYNVTQYSERASATNLTLNNYLGFPAATYSNGTSATIRGVGQISPTTNLSGLDVGALYYIQKNGTISTIPDSPYVVAGVAITTDSIFISNALADTSVIAGTYTKMTVDAKGRVIAASTLTETDVPSLSASKITSGTFDSARLPIASSTAIGGIELGSDTVQTTAANAVTSTASRTYALQVNAAGQGVVNVPWTGDVTTSGVQTLTNKTIVPRSVNSGSTSGNITVTADNADIYNITGLTGDIILLTPSGTPSHGQKIILVIKDNGTSRNVTWTTTSGAFRAIGVTLPTSTTSSKTIYAGCIYNSIETFWDVVAVTTQA